jgi:small subunit ribosomal protein S17
MAEETEDTAPAPADESAGAPEEAAVTEAAATRTDSAPGAQAAEVVAPKERRRRARAEKAAKAGARPSRTPEERQEERRQERARKAGSRRAQRVRTREKARAAHDTGRQTPPREHVPGRAKERQGVVVSNKADKTITVRIDVARRHRRYDKIVRTSTTLHVHDESNDANVGDTVIVREARPLSRTKRWRLVQVVQRAK